MPRNFATLEPLELQLSFTILLLAFGIGQASDQIVPVVNVIVKLA